MKIFLAIFGVLIVAGAFAAFQFRGEMSSARLGSDAIYTLDSQGNASVEMVNKTYYTDPNTKKNFDDMIARLGQPNTQAFQNGVEDSLKNVSDRTGWQIVVSGFEGGFERHSDYGAQVYRFRWADFAQQNNGMWIVDFRAANSMKLTKDSSLTIVLPPGATLVKVDPTPIGGNTGGKLAWTGPSELPWPYVEYK